MENWTSAGFETAALNPRIEQSLEKQKSGVIFHFNPYLLSSWEVQAGHQEVFHQEVTQPWSRCPSRATETPPSEVFKTWVEAPAADLIPQWQGSCFEAELQISRGPFQPPSLGFCDTYTYTQ